MNERSAKPEANKTNYADEENRDAGDREISFPIYIDTNNTILELLLDTEDIPVEVRIGSQEATFEIWIEQLHSDLISDWFGAVFLFIPTLVVVSIHTFITCKLRKLYQQTNQTCHGGAGAKRKKEPQGPSSHAIWPVYCVWCSEKCTRGLFCNSCGASLVFPDAEYSDMMRQKVHLIQKRIQEETGINASEHRLRLSSEDEQISAASAHYQNSTSMFTPGLSRPSRPNRYLSENVENGETESLLSSPTGRK